MQVNIQEAKKWIIDCMKAGIVPMLEGAPATGKSDLIREIGKQFNLYILDIRLSQLEPTDLNNN